MERESRTLVEEIVDDLRALGEERRDGALRAILLDLHPADIADLLARLRDEDLQRYLFGLITDREVASDVLAEADSSVREHILEGMPAADLADLVEEMSSDDAADVVQELSDLVAEQVLREVEHEEREAMRPLLEHGEETAGGIMASELIAVPLGSTIDDALAAVRAKAEEMEPVFFVYVVDGDRRLKGVLSLRQLVMHQGDTPVAEIMNEDPHSVPPEMDQEHVAHVFRRYDLVALPVVDATGRLLGRITVDDVVDVMREEAEEDIARIAGMDEEQFNETSVRRVVFYRLPWIQASLLGGLISGAILNYFTISMGLALSLLAFVPVIMAMGGNAGSQAAITMVRLLAFRKLSRSDVISLVWREARIGLLLGFTAGIIVGVVALLWKANWFYGVVVGISMNTAILFAVTMGAIIPIVFQRLRVDPAIATGPFVSMSNDATGLVIYFTLAALLNRLLPGVR